MYDICTMHKMSLAIARVSDHSCMPPLKAITELTMTHVQYEKTRLTFAAIWRQYVALKRAPSLTAFYIVTRSSSRITQSVR